MTDENKHRNNREPDICQCETNFIGKPEVNRNFSKRFVIVDNQKLRRHRSKSFFDISRQNYSKYHILNMRQYWTNKKLIWFKFFSENYREDLEKQGEGGVVAHERHEIHMSQ